MKSKTIALVFLLCLGLAIPAFSATQGTYGFTAAAVALDVDLDVLYDIKVTQIQINLSAAATTSEDVYIRRLSSTGAVLSEYRFDPSATSATVYSIFLDGWLATRGEVIAIDYANTDVLDVETGSNITYERSCVTPCPTHSVSL